MATQSPVTGKRPQGKAREGLHTKGRARTRGNTKKSSAKPSPRGESPTVLPLAGIPATNDERARANAYRALCAEINRWLKTSRQCRCLVRVELASSIEVACRGCNTKRGQADLFRRVLARVAEEHGFAVDLNRHWVECILISGDTIVLTIATSPLSPEAKLEERIEVVYRALPESRPDPRLPTSSRHARNGKKLAKS